MAAGGHSTTYLTAFGVYSASLYYKMHGLSYPTLINKLNPHLGKPVFLLGVGAAAFFVAMNTIGDSREFWHLSRNYLTYRREFKMIKDELYYS